MDREAIKTIIEKQKTILSLALSKGVGSADIRVDEVVAENAQETITKLESLIELKMHPDPEINKEVNADIQAGEVADTAAGLPPQKLEEGELDERFRGWTPTPENVNRLPEPLRQYIHDIETKCDPAGDAQQILLLKDTVNGQVVRIKELENACDIFEKNSNEASEVFELLMRHSMIPAEKPGPRLAAVVADIVYLSEKVHTMLGRFPGSDLCKAAEVRLNEYKAMTEKYEAMKLQIEEAEKSVKFLLDTEAMDAPDVAALVSAALIVKDLPEPGRKAVQAFIRNIQRLEDKLESKTSEHNRWVLAVKKHQSQKGDDRCWLDDATLYQETGLQGAETALPGRDEFLENCSRFHESRVHPSDKNKYITVEQRITEARTQWETEGTEQLKEKEKTIKKLGNMLDKTVVDLRAAVKVQRTFGETKTISGRQFASSMTKYVLPALKRLGWVPTKEEVRVGKANGRVRGR